MSATARRNVAEEEEEEEVVVVVEEEVVQSLVSPACTRGLIFH